MADSGVHLPMRLILALILCVVSSVSPTQAAVFDLEITNIKPAGTGSPAISSSNRIFRAYPGIEYNIRAAVIGGLYPYTYSLSNAPSGMTINSATGEIIWTDPQANSGTITLTVIDTENTTVSTTWAITVTSSTTDFIFIDSAYSGTETGSTTQPYTSVANMLNAEVNNTNKIVYLKAGTYYYPEFNSNPNPHWMDLNNSPRVWIAYPGQAVTLQGSASGTNANTIYNNVATVYFDRLTIRSGVEYTMLLANSPYTTVRRCVFDGLTTNTSVNNNQGMIYMPNGMGVQSYIVIQDNEFTNFVGGQAIGSLYRTNKILIENNYTHDGGQPGLSAFCDPVGIKAYNTYYTIRGNQIIIPADASTLEIYNEGVDQDYGEFNYNYVKRISGGSDNALLFFYPETFYMQRNTFVGDIEFYTNLSDGPYYFDNNVLIGSLVNATYLTSTDTLTGAIDIIDTSGKLTSGYAQYVGTRGWQFADGSTPMEGFYAPPDPTCSDLAQNGDETGIDCGGGCPACSGGTQTRTRVYMGITPVSVGSTAVQ